MSLTVITGSVELVGWTPPAPVWAPVLLSRDLARGAAETLRTLGRWIAARDGVVTLHADGHGQRLTARLSPADLDALIGSLQRAAA